MKDYVVEIQPPRGDIRRVKFGDNGDIAASFAGTIMAQKVAADYNVELVDLDDSRTIVIKVTDR